MKNSALVFLFLSVAMCVQVSGQNIAVNDKSHFLIKQELSFSFKPFYTFSKFSPQEGTFHPVKFVHPITMSYEINYALSKNHFMIESNIRKGKIRFYLPFTQNPDSSNSPYQINYSPLGSLVHDTINFVNFGLKAGKIGSITKKISYEFLFGINLFKYIQDSANFHSSYLFKANGHSVIELSLGLGRELNFLLESTFKIKYNLFRNIFLQSSLTYCDWYRPDFEKPLYLYNIIYQFYSSNGVQTSWGRAYSRLNQLQLGLGLSYLF